ncbi:RIP metalloprotease RseP [Pseudoduganella buxea]|nr:RIP metalloprotease RseP [Pseudoduganella buxea]
MMNGVLGFLQTLLAFAGAFGTLVVLHELGHCVVARWCGVKVLRFSVGWGRVVWSWRSRPDGIEWALSSLPLGGYVRMLDARDQDVKHLSEDDLRHEFTRQNVWKRIAIIAAGPATNFLLAIVLLAGLYMHGVEEPSARIAEPAAATPARQAGLHRGDIIVAVGGEAVASWSEMRWQLIRAATDGEQQDVPLTVRRPGRGDYTFTLPAAALNDFDPDSDVAAAVGLALALPPPVLGRVDPAGPGGRAGLQPGDRIAAIDGVPVVDVGAFMAIVRAAPGKQLVLDVRRGAQALRLSIVPEASPAGAGGKGSVTVGKIRVELTGRPDMIVVSDGPFGALAKAVTKVWDTSVLTVRMIGRMLTGDVSWKNVTGPITIADYAGQTSRIGVASYLSFIAMVSISLGVMNLLPIPVLDGGHLLYYSLEVLTGRPVPERFGEIAQRLGVGLLVTLMALAVFNDVVRLM